MQEQRQANPRLGDILRQKPLIRRADTRSLMDVAKEKGAPFEEVFDEAVKNMQYIHIPDEFKLRHILKRKVKTGFQKFRNLFRHPIS